MPVTAVVLVSCNRGLVEWANATSAGEGSYGPTLSLSPDGIAEASTSSKAVGMFYRGTGA